MNVDKINDNLQYLLKEVRKELNKRKDSIQYEKMNKQVRDIERIIVMCESLKDVHINQLSLDEMVFVHGLISSLINLGDYDAMCMSLSELSAILEHMGL